MQRQTSTRRIGEGHDPRPDWDRPQAIGHSRMLRRRVAVAAVLGLIFGLAPSPARAGQVLTWDGSNISRASFTLISCFPYASSQSIWRSGYLPVSGSWEYKSSGSAGILPDYIGLVQCTVRAYDKRGKLVGYPAPIHWQFTT